MFKRSLTAVAVLGVMAGAAAAADVQLYGVIDTGIALTRTDASTSFNMLSGGLSGSRLGVKGTEDLGNGLTVGFKLESGIKAINGEAGDVDDGSFFNREATLNVAGAFGKVIVGRMGVLSSSAGPVGIGDIDPLGAGTVIGGFGNVRNDFASRIDNAVAYVSPEFAGTNVYVQYGMGAADGTGKSMNKKTSSGRYLGLGATFERGPLNVVAVIDTTLAQQDAKSTNYRKNQYALTAGVSYDFGVVKPTFQLAAFRNATGLNNYKIATTAGEALANGFGTQLAAEIPAGPGVAVASIGYGHANSKNNVATKAADKLSKYNTWNLGAAYVYPMSKRTSLYAGAGYLRAQEKVISSGAKTTTSVYQAAFGIKHTF